MGIRATGAGWHYDAADRRIHRTVDGDCGCLLPAPFRGSRTWRADRHAAADGHFVYGVDFCYRVSEIVANGDHLLYLSRRITDNADSVLNILRSCSNCHSDGEDARSCDRVPNCPSHLDLRLHPQMAGFQPRRIAGQAFFCSRTRASINSRSAT
jgi:hypothetical protein